MNIRDDSSDCNRRVNEVIAAYLQAQAAGQPPDRAAIVAEHPELAAELEAFFADHDALKQMAQGVTETFSPGAAPIPDSADAPPDTHQLRPNTLVRYFGDYELLQEIARGGMGVVYRARQVSLNRIVALKMILAGQLASPDDVDRFRREAEAAANLDHPNIVPIHEVGEHEGQHYFSMKLIEGGSLASQRMPLAARRTAELAAAVARAIHYAHQRGILHRDLKPGNILLDAADQPYVTDFGLAKHVEAKVRHTRTGSIVGTPSYMAPEQARSDKVLTTAVDVYSLGAILYELITGRPPFRAETPLETVLRVMETEPVAPSKINRRIDRDVETICLKCLEKDPGKRYGSAEALAEELERWLRGEPIEARQSNIFERTGKWVRRKPLQAALSAVVLGAAAIIVGVVFVSSRQVREERQTTAVAAKAKEVAEDVAKTIRSVQGAAVAERALDSGDPFIAVRRLEKIEPELRGWEWFALRRRAQADLRFLVAPPMISKVDGVDRGSGPSLVKTVTLLSGRPDLAAVCGGLYESSAELTLWDSARKEIIRTHARVYEPVAVSSDGDLFACLESPAGAVVIRDMRTGEVIGTPPHPGTIFTLAFSPDGNRLAAGVGSGPKDAAAVVWDVETGRVVCRCSGYQAPVGLVAFNPDGGQLAAASQAPNELVLWDATDGHEIRRFSQAGEIRAMAFSPRGDLLASTDSHHIVFWDVATGTARRTISRQNDRPSEDYLDTTWGNDYVFAIAFSRDGRYLAAGATGSIRERHERIRRPGAGTVRLWEVGTGRQVLLLRGGIGRAYSLSFSPDGRRIAWCGRENGLTVCDLERLQTAMSLRGEGLVAVSPDGRLVACCDGRAHIYETASGRLVQRLLGEGIFNALGVAFSHDGKRIAGGLVGGTWDVPIWEVATGRKVGSLKAEGPAFGIAFSPDDRLVLLAHGQRLRVCEATTGNVVFEPKSQDKIYCGAFSPDGSRLATGGLKSVYVSGGEVVVWDVATWKPVRRFSGLFNGATSVAWNHDGSQIAACAGVPLDDGSTRRQQDPHEVLVWDVTSGQERLRLAGHAAEVNAVLFTPDGNRLITAGADRAIKVWDAKLGLEIMTLRRPSLPIIGLALSRDGGVLAAGGRQQGRAGINAEGKRDGLWIWNARPLDPAPEGRRYPLLETAKDWDIGELLSNPAGPARSSRFPPTGSVPLP